MIKPWAERMRDGMSAVEARTQEINELRAALIDRYPQIEALRAAPAAAPVQAQEPAADIWTCTRMHDMGTVKDSKGEFIAQSYFKDMKTLTDRHNVFIPRPGAARGRANPSPNHG